MALSETVTPPQDISTAGLVKRLVKEHIRPYAGWVKLALAAMAVVAAATAFSAWLMDPVVNRIFIEKREDLLLLIGGAVLVTFLIKGAANYAQSALMALVGQRIITDAQHRLYGHLTRMELAFFQDEAAGGLISRFTVDINMMRAAVTNALTGLGKDSLMLIGLIGVMFFQDWQLAIISFVVFPPAVFAIVRLGKRIRKVTVNTQAEMGELATILNQTFQGARVVKAYSMEEYEKRRVGDVAERIFRLVFKSARIRAMASPIMETLGGFAAAMVVLYGGFRVIGGTMDAGSFFSFITALLMAYEPLKRLANLNASLQEGLAGAQRLFALLDREPDITEAPDAKPLDVRGGGVRFDNVRFSYREDRPALMGMSLDVPAGKTAALVGPSGAGKSTILNLIPRFHDADAGAVSIDGHDVRGLTFDSLRGAIALVSQEITLFDDTIRANIAYGRQSASEDEIIRAARDAAADAFIRELPQGYDTLVGEMGAHLSGGQRQRIAIARAMLKDAPILLLDEATSALDTESERQVQAALRILMQGRTTLVIAHRLSTIMDADIIHVVDRGKLAESGSHAELLARGGIYANLYALQFADQEDDSPPDHAVAAAGE